MTEPSSIRPPRAAAGRRRHVSIRAEPSWRQRGPSTSRRGSSIPRSGCRTRSFPRIWQATSFESFSVHGSGSVEFGLDLTGSWDVGGLDPPDPDFSAVVLRADLFVSELGGVRRRPATPSRQAERTGPAAVRDGLRAAELFSAGSRWPVLRVQHHRGLVVRADDPRRDRGAGGLAFPSRKSRRVDRFLRSGLPVRSRTDPPAAERVAPARFARGIGRRAAGPEPAARSKGACLTPDASMPLRCGVPADAGGRRLRLRSALQVAEVHDKDRRGTAFSPGALLR